MQKSNTYVMDKVASHLPVLDLIKRLSCVRRILELGSGVYSTNKLLEYPALERLTSYEDHKAWYDEFGLRDDKWVCILEGDLPGLVGRIDLDEFDLIFVDCSDTAPRRAQVLEALFSRRPDAIVVLHDYEDSKRVCPMALAYFDNVMVYDTLWPGTAILWNQIEGSTEIQNVYFDEEGQGRCRTT